MARYGEGVEPARPAPPGSDSWADSRLAVYGTLRPGQENHDLVDELQVEAHGTVTGRLTWWEGYPVLIIEPGGRPVPVVVLTSPFLRDRFDELDRFEGPAYRREIVVVELDDGPVRAHCYVASALVGASGDQSGPKDETS